MSDTTVFVIDSLGFNSYIDEYIAAQDDAVKMFGIGLVDSILNRSTCRAREDILQYFRISML